MKVARHAVAWRAVLGAVLVTALVTVLAVASMRLLPPTYRGTGVGMTFLLSTYALVWRRGDRSVERAGLGLGGLVAPSVAGSGTARTSLSKAARALAWALAMAVLTFPPFFLGWRAVFHPAHAFVFPGARFVLTTAATQLVGVALPEEAFYRGYLQSRLARSFRLTRAPWPMTLAIVGTSALFALGHVATLPYAARLTVFFPSLLFGWLRARTGGIGASTAFHAFCNTWSELLGVAYGLY